VRATRRCGGGTVHTCEPDWAADSLAAIERGPRKNNVPAVSPSFDLDAVEWRRIADPTFTAFKIDFEYSLLGYDVAAGRLDMLLRYASGGHCRRHRHSAATVTMVLEGEQCLTEMRPGGTTKSVHRKAGDTALSAADAYPHDENGGTIYLSMSAPDGVLFEYFDENMENPRTLSIREYAGAWYRKTVHGAAPERKVAANA